MRFNVAGDDPETGQALEMVVEADTLEEAAAAAKRRQMTVMSVTPAELEEPDAPSATRPSPRSPGAGRQVKPSRPGAGLRKFVTIGLLGSVCVGMFVPTLPLVMGVGMLVSIGLFVIAPPMRAKTRVLLGVWRDKPVHGAFKLMFLSAYSLSLIGLWQVGEDFQERMRLESEQAAAEELARAQALGEAAALVGEAKQALRDGDIETATARATAANARATVSSSGAAARDLIARIDGSLDPKYVLNVLARMPDEEFQSFRDSGELTSSLDLGFEVLNTRILSVAPSQLDFATKERVRLAEERDERLAEQQRLQEAKQEETRVQNQAKRDADRARRSSEQRGAENRLKDFNALLAATGTSIVERVGVRKIGDDTWEATLTVGNVWHIRHKQLRLQDAETLWEAWAGIANPKKPDQARIKIVDRKGNSVGGSRVWGGSLIWVDD